MANVQARLPKTIKKEKDGLTVETGQKKNYCEISTLSILLISTLINPNKLFFNSK